jgi:hypothetical protein
LIPFIYFDAHFWILGVSGGRNNLVWSTIF